MLRKFLPAKQDEPPFLCCIHHSRKPIMCPICRQLRWYTVNVCLANATTIISRPTQYYKLYGTRLSVSHYIDRSHIVGLLMAFFNRIELEFATTHIYK